MNRSNITRCGILLVSLILSLTGCAAPKSTISPTATSQPKPTMPSATATETPALTITYSKDDKCSLEGATTITSPATIKWVVDGQKSGGYVLALVSLAQGKTLADLQVGTTGEPPSWVNVGDVFTAERGSQRIYHLSSNVGTYYFACIYYEQTDTLIGVLGPVEVVKAP